MDSKAQVGQGKPTREKIIAMAPRKTANQAPTAGAESPLTRTDTPVDYKAFLAPSSGLVKVSRGRGEAVNPLAGAVAQSLDNALMLPVGNGEEARKVTNYLRRDLGDQELRLSIQYQDGNGNVLRATREKVDGKTVTNYPAGIREVHFVAKAGKTERKYTVADIRAWANENGYGEITGPVPASIRDAFKVALGYTKDGQSA